MPNKKHSVAYYLIRSVVRFVFYGTVGLSPLWATLIIHATTGLSGK